jgi:hypothetical protein
LTLPTTKSSPYTSARQVLALVERLIMAGSREATIITAPPDDGRILGICGRFTPCGASIIGTI